MAKDDKKNDKRDRIWAGVFLGGYLTALFYDIEAAYRFKERLDEVYTSVSVSVGTFGELEFQSTEF